MKIYQVVETDGYPMDETSHGYFVSESLAVTHRLKVETAVRKAEGITLMDGEEWDDFLMPIILRVIETVDE